MQVIPDADQTGKQKPSAWLEMFYYRTSSTPLNIDHFKLELQNHPDKKCVSFIGNGLREGFDTLIPNLILPNKECKNLLSAHKNPEVIDELLDQECKKGFLHGSFSEPPFESYRVSPLGLAIGKYSGKKEAYCWLILPT